MPDGPCLFTARCDDPRAFGVWDPAAGRITEKPEHPASGLAVTGLYVYDQRVFDVIRGLEPSARGELEITDVSNWYLERGLIGVREITGAWSDMGTPGSLLTAALHRRETACGLAARELADAGCAG